MVDFGDVGANSVKESEVRTNSILTEYKRIKQKLHDPKVPEGKKEKLSYRLSTLEDVHASIISFHLEY